MRKFRVQKQKEGHIDLWLVMYAETPEAAIKELHQIETCWLDSPEGRNYSLYQGLGDDNADLYAVVEYHQCEGCKDWFDVNLHSGLCRDYWEDVHNPSR